MATPDHSLATDQDELQFEHAEFPAEVGAASEPQISCSVCTAAIPELYYEANGKVLCPPCRDRIEAGFQQGSRLGRVIKAFVFGSIAAAIGAILYYAIMKITGWNIGIVAIVVGVLVGGAVKAGSGNRGGRFYQFLALFLTYSAIVAMGVPELMNGFIQEFRRDAAAQKAGADLKPVPEPAEAPHPQPRPDAGKKDVPVDAPAVQPPPAQEKPISLLGMLAAVAVVLAILLMAAYATPVLVAVNSPISGLIFGFALWEAWKINRKVQLAFNGPFRLATQASDAVAIEPEETNHES